MSHNIGTILVLFILLVIVACSCGVLGRNERKNDRQVENINERNNERKHERVSDRNYGGSCGLGY
ncbi:hypothetical protein [Bacillus sp. FJAT-28004]|uniref:hypothetical protein n=1 Tax=Bacillus sp. FJAT-28004 TaxID=1679165 RepID=UPI0006B56FCD|nr:hypothetical protein [Bacillus sp. FJAT-28004]